MFIPKLASLMILKLTAFSFGFRHDGDNGGGDDDGDDDNDKEEEEEVCMQLIFFKYNGQELYKSLEDKLEVVKILDVPHKT